MGGIWGVSEIVLGGLLHLFRIPFRGIVLTTVGFFLMLSLKRFVPHFGSILLASIIVICFKLMSPNPFLSNIIMAIILEAIFWEFILHFIKNNYIGSFICALYTGVLCATTSLLGYLIFGGLSFQKAYNLYIKQVAFFTESFGYKLDPFILYIIMNVLLTIILFMIATKQSESLIKRFND